MPSNETRVIKVPYEFKAKKQTKRNANEISAFLNKTKRKT